MVVAADEAEVVAAGAVVSESENGFSGRQVMFVVAFPGGTSDWKPPLVASCHQRRANNMTRVASFIEIDSPS